MRVKHDALIAVVLQKPGANTHGMLPFLVHDDGLKVVKSMGLRIILTKIKIGIPFAFRENLPPYFYEYFSS